MLFSSLLDCDSSPLVDHINFESGYFLIDFVVLEWFGYMSKLGALSFHTKNSLYTCMFNTPNVVLLKVSTTPLLILGMILDSYWGVQWSHK